EPVFDAVDTLLLVLPAMAGLIATMRVNTARLEQSAPEGFALATDLAELLVRKGVPFREAHEAVGHLVVYCQVNDKDFGDLTDEELAKVSPHFAADAAGLPEGTPSVRDVLSVRGALAARSAYGGTAPDRVREQVAALREIVDEQAAWANSES